MKLTENLISVLPLMFLAFGWWLWERAQFWPALVMIILAVFFGFCVVGIVSAKNKRG